MFFYNVVQLSYKKSTRGPDFSRASFNILKSVGNAISLGQTVASIIRLPLCVTGEDEGASFDWFSERGNEGLELFLSL